MMKTNAVLSLLLILTWCGCSRADVQSTNASVGAPLTVMSFNVRNGKANDGDNHWQKRKELCASRVTHFNPDVLGLQEAFAFQNEFILAKCPGYTAVGVGRDDGHQAGEFSTLLLRTERFSIIESGTFWLSKTPTVAGSKSWDSSLPRIATWARVKDRSAGEKEILVINTHFDHRGVEARIQAAKIIRNFIAESAKGAAVIVTGDFNSKPGSEPYHTLTDRGADGMQLHDAYADLYRDKPEPNDGTAHNYKEVTSPRIDWILHTDAFTATSATIDRHRVGPLFPSDHFAVVATLHWK